MRNNLYGTISPEPSELELRNRALARRAATEGFVLLKNEGGALPLMSKKIALYGMGARKTVKGGLGSGSVEECYSVNIEDGLKNAGYEITTQKWLDDYDAEYATTYQAYHDMVEEKVAGLTNPMEIIPPGPQIRLALLQRAGNHGGGRGGERHRHRNLRPHAAGRGGELLRQAGGHHPPAV